MWVKPTGVGEWAKAIRFCTGLLQEIYKNIMAGCHWHQKKHSVYTRYPIYDGFEELIINSSGKKRV